jgi:predicted flap endonuclease-1-like 5' DNA nuclease
MVSEIMRVESSHCDHEGEAVSLHLSKVRGTNLQIRARLKCCGVTNSRQLLRAAGAFRARVVLSGKTGIDMATLAYITKRADLARVKGIGATFADMLEVLGIDTVECLAGWAPDALHRTLFDFNRTERFARRAPTPEEIEAWVTQARNLPVLIDHI